MTKNYISIEKIKIFYPERRILLTNRDFLPDFEEKKRYYADDADH